MDYLLKAALLPFTIAIALGACSDSDEATKRGPTISPIPIASSPISLGYGAPPKEYQGRIWVTADRCAYERQVATDGRSVWNLLSWPSRSGAAQAPVGCKSNL